MKGNTLNQKRPAPSLILQTRSPTHQPPNPRILPAENDTQSPGDAVVLTPVPPPGPPPPPENIPDTMTRSLGFSLPVTVVVLAIAYIYFSTVFIFIDRWFGLMSSPGLMNAVVFTGVAVMCVFNYSASVFRDPGRVPSTYMPDVEDSGNPMHEIKRKMCMHQMENLYLETLTDLSTKGGDLRYCQKCSHYKPARAHHCRVCKRCVLRMDHHCIWINNCVGHANYKVFFIFVVYAVIACLYSLVLLVGSLTYDPEKEDQEPGDSFQTAYVISGLLLVPLCVALSVLLGWHIYLTLQNKTTIEYHEGVRGMWLAEKGGQIYSHPYDRGAYENLTTVLGSNICSWALPTSGHIGSGLHFRTAYDYPSGASMSE
ncbi:probable protein S-acyltransferase 16 isoform X2 [Pyrus x bretschneideri]|uniref:probable protein S-acyltransferase 16 isoform X2 n=1 Tax=Pyrus x bretschneideri TaxID=225117 RepID=UPI00202E0B12|nr:probable protein S-acyltransferase 16 isoform X2 [Pyrus x bretschneideri]